MSHPSRNEPAQTFSELGLSDPILKSLGEIGYETPSPIQAATIPYLLENRDVLGQAQTGTGKTAAFALPILSRVDLKQKTPQALVLAPTRELAIQVAEAFQTYATHLPGFHVLPIYGGQSYGPQLSSLRRGVHVVVGTPGRVIDHLDKGSLDLSQVKTLVLDEADEMLRMGFIDDVERILQDTPQTRQTTLFSATMPPAIKRIAQTYLKSPEEITIAAKTTTAENIRQRFWLVSGMHKLDALTRILEVEEFDGMIIFVRTKLGTEELAEKLQARGFSAGAINGDIQQVQRERLIQQLRDGKIDILVATDVAARGLDVERISHVVNYDVPYDPESYTHRIGRTGRAGRSGEAILFITPREKGLLRVIERATRQNVTPLELPSVQAVNDVRIARFKEQISQTIAEGGLEHFQSIVEDFEREFDTPALEIAAALAKMARGDVPLLLEKIRRGPNDEVDHSRERAPRERGRERERDRERDREPRGRATASQRSFQDKKFDQQYHPRQAEPGMTSFRIQVGHDHGVKPGNIVGAIANEANIDSKHIGRIEIYDDFSVLDLPSDLPKEMLQHLKKVWVAGRQLQIAVDGAIDHEHDHAPAPTAKKEFKKHKRDEYQEFDNDVVARDQLRSGKKDVKEAKAKDKKPKAAKFHMENFRIEVGRRNQVTPSEIVQAIADGASIDPKHVGRIELFDSHSIVELPEGMPPQIMSALKTTKLACKKLGISHAENFVAHMTDAGDKFKSAKSDKPKGPPRSGKRR